MTAPAEPRCAIAEWDSHFFATRIGRLHADRPSQEDVDRAVQWAEAQGVECLYALVDAEASGSSRALESYGFHLADIRLTLDRPSDVGAAAVPNAGWRIEAATPRDAQALMALARESHTGTRFTEDPHFDRTRAADLYAEWIGKALAESATGSVSTGVVLVSRRADQVAGYLSLHMHGRQEATIGLVAVSETTRNHGIGQALVGAAVREAAAHGAPTVSVVTQGRNAASVRFYERCGFQTRRCQLWYHRWAGR